MKELAKTYNPKEIEQVIYDRWLEKKYFHAEVDESKKPFTIIMPPPNITGQLHMGHALNNTLQDIVILLFDRFFDWCYYSRTGKYVNGGGDIYEEILQKKDKLIDI